MYIYVYICVRMNARIVHNMGRPVTSISIHGNEVICVWASVRASAYVRKIREITRVGDKHMTNVRLLLCSVKKMCQLLLVAFSPSENEGEGDAYMAVSISFLKSES